MERDTTTVEFKQYGNYKPWEHGYFQFDSSYKKGDQRVYCYRNYFNGKMEVVESSSLIDCNKVNNQFKVKFQ